MKYRIEVRNEALGTLHLERTFATVEEAQAYCEATAKRCQNFVTLQPCQEHNGALVGVQVRGPAPIRRMP